MANHDAPIRIIHVAMYTDENIEPEFTINPVDNPATEPDRTPATGVGPADHQCHPERTTMPDNTEPSGAQRMFGDFAPGLVDFTDNTLFGDVWKRPDLTPRDRSLVTVTALVTNGNTGQLTFHLALAKENGVTEAELIEAITHLAFYTGWPQAMAAMAVAKQVFRGEDA